MSIAQTAILATALRPKSGEVKSSPTSIADSIAQRPLQWLVVAGAIVYFGGKAIKNILPTGENIRKGQAETTTSIDNPFSANTFLAQKIPKDTKLLLAKTSFNEAKKVYDALNTFFADDADIAVGVFAALPSKLQVAQVVQSFEAFYKRNILEYLQNGKKTFDFGTGGLSKDLYDRILENVKRKPKF